MKSKHEPLVKLEGVWKIYTMGEVEVPAIKDVSFDIFENEFIAIIGSSGSGKSTIMNIVGCLDKPSKGKVFLDGQDISKLSESDLATLRGKKVGFIFQQYNLIPTMSAFANVKLPLEFQDEGDDVANKRVDEILDLVDLSEKKHHLPSQLSGGQQQRVSIARCLAANPRVILADEPTGALDSKTGKQVLEILHNLWKKEGKTVVMITHDLKLAEYASKIIELKDGKVLRIYDNESKSKKKIKLSKE